MITATINSTQNGRSLTFSEYSADYFKVEIFDESISAVKKVWGYTDTFTLVDLFASIAHDWKGWDGKRKWESIEGDLIIAASSDKLGHIRIEICIRNNDLENDWMIQAPIYLDSGSLDAIAQSIDRFFNQK